VYSTPKASLLGSLAGLFCLVPNRVYQIWGARWQTLTGMKLFITKSMDKITILCSTNVVGVSKSIADLYNTFTSKRIDVLGLGSAVGVDPKLFYPGKSSYKTLTLGFAGRIAKDKGIEDLLNIYELVKKKKPECTLQIIGDIDLDDPVSPNIIENISSDVSITWIKHSDRKQLGKFMRNWQLQLFPSSREGLGNVIIEAGACGIPTICWDVTGVRDAIPDFLGENLIENNRMDLLYSRIKRYLDNPLSTMEASKLSSWTIENFERNKVLSNFANHVNHKILEMNSQD
jgi:glycosyltransferase involved in cell wall biosynthesis